MDLASRYRPIGSFADPSRPSSIINVRTLGKQHGLLGLNKCVAGYNPIQEGNNQFHSLIFQRRLKIPRYDYTNGRKDHLSGDTFFNLLSNYHYLVDKAGTVTDKIAPNQNDHAIDASRYTIARKLGSI